MSKMANQTSASKNVEQPGLAKHDSAILDLAFAMDCTGSMGSYIDTARQNIRRIAEEIVAAEKSDIRFALVEYRDHPPQDSTFVTRVHDFTPSLGTVKTWLDSCSAQGGGDTPEAVADALHQLFKLNWREEATKICVFIADAPPHGLSPSGDSFPNGCPDGLDPLTVTRNLAEKGITIYMVGCEPSIVPYKDFMMTLSYITGGQYVPLSCANLLTQVIIGGAQEEITLERFMEDVNQRVQQEVQASGGRFDDEAITRKVHAELKEKSYRSKHLNLNRASLPQASTQAQMWSGYDCMADVRKEVTSKEAAPAESSGGIFSRMFGAFGGSSAPPPPPPAGGARSYASASSPMSAAPSADMYDVVEDDISVAQASRMVQKSKVRGGYS